MIASANAAADASAEPFVVSGEQSELSAITLKDRSLSEYAQWQKPAASDSRPSSDYIDNFARNAGDALFFSPGVWINGHDAYEQRLVLRGFAVGNRQQRANAVVLRDGAPLTDVHGATNLREIDLLAVQRVDVFRGGAGPLGYGGENFGGIVNYVSPTGLNMLAGLRGRVDAGSSIEGTPGGRVHLDFAGVSPSGVVDYFVSATGGYESGFRDNNEMQDGVFNANIGFRLSSNFKTRFFFETVYSGSELAGGLSPADAAADPSQAAPPITLGPLFPGGPIIEFADGASADNFSRDLLVGRVANRTQFNVFGHDFDARLHYTRRDLESPQIDFIGVLDETGSEWGARLSASRNLQFFNIDTTYRFGGAYSTGEQDSNRFENDDGEAGFQTVDTRQKSTNLNAFFEAALRPFKKLLVDMGAKFIITDRELTVDDGDTPEDARFTGVAAKLGVVYDLFEDVKIFANASRTYEPPAFSELIADNPEDFNDLDEQDSFTYEAGVRGSFNDWIGWDVTYFNSDIENEIINLDEPETNGIGSTLANVAETTHKGFEVGLDIHLMPNRTDRALTLRNVYSYNDFRFVDAGSIGDFDGNRIAGIPQHVYRGELRYDETGRWFAAVNVQAVAGDFYADHENAFSAPSDIVLGFSAGWQLTDQAVLFVSGENITDTNYAAGVTPVTSQSTVNGRIFTPASRASVYGGLKYRF
ncbi:Probable TonB-dependent receptor YncD [Durusdinium trenchii]|uniref:Probable TonB-dependent receptor YncD n=1 Tax=Durusdinium trenchii TaxID=1381693 RepID=A0ABP0LL38_9DINO